MRKSAPPWSVRIAVPGTRFTTAFPSSCAIRHAVSYELFYAAVREAVGWVAYPLILLDGWAKRRPCAHKIACEFRFVGFRGRAHEGEDSPRPSA